MTYTLSRLAPGSYDVLLDGVIIASLVRSGSKSDTTWTAELLEDVHPRPAPFTELEHQFGSLEEAQKMQADVILPATLQNPTWTALLGPDDSDRENGRSHPSQPVLLRPNNSDRGWRVLRPVPAWNSST